MTDELLVERDSDAARREMCRDRGLICSWAWESPRLGGTPGPVYLEQNARCEACGRERSEQLTLNTFLRGAPE